MKSVFRSILITILLGIILNPIARGALITNSWTDGSSKWENATDWTAGEPSQANAINFIVGGIPVGNRVITVDGVTALSNSLNSCLTINNLTIMGTANASDTLFLNTSTPGTIGLNVINAFTLLAHGFLSITNSYLYVGSAGPNTDGIFDDGFLTLNTGTLSTLASTVNIGYNGSGVMTMQAGTWLGSSANVGENPGSQGTLTIAGGIVNLGSSLVIAPDSGGGGTVWLTGGQLVITNSGAGIGFDNPGVMTVSNGTWKSIIITVGPQGTLNIAGGTNTFNSLFLDGLPPVTGTATVWMTGGELLGSDGIDMADDGDALITISNGFCQVGGAIIGNDSSEIGIPSSGTLTVAGGTGILGGTALGVVSNCSGTIWLTGGSLTGGTSYIGELGQGRLTVSNGIFFADQILAGAYFGSFGTVTISGGQVMVTNGLGRISVGGAGATHLTQFNGSGQARMFVGGGTLTTRLLDVGSDFSLRSDLEIGSSALITVSSKMTVGDCTSNALGTVVMTGGKLYVTNATHDAVLEIRNGFFLLDGGTLVVDKLVITNTCYGILDHSGGTLTVGTLVVDPNGDADGDGLPNSWEQQHGLDPLSSIGNNGADGDPDGDGYSNWDEYLAGSDPQDPSSTPVQITAPPYFQIILIQRSGNNILLNWTAHSGTTNQVQVTSGGTGGSYSTNGFTNLGPTLFVGGSGIVTNTFTDIGGATNKPARYYRVRLVP